MTLSSRVLIRPYFTYGQNGQSTFWSHFNANETDNAGDNMYDPKKRQVV
jgi:hypothetical protein